MIAPTHPYYFLSALLGESGTVATLSRYIYTPDSLFDHREYVTIPGSEFSEAKVNQEIGMLRSDQELAIHSKVKCKGRTWHIPMIDFSTDDATSHMVFDRMSRYLSKETMLSMAVYASGRSYHAYSSNLLSPKEWLDFMGRLLLINPRNQKEIVDSRWVGHRVIGGFASLRWSNNSGKYAGMPSRVTFPR